MNEPRNVKPASEKKTVYYGRSMSVVCLISGTGLIVATPFLLFVTKQVLLGGIGPMQEESVAPILMTFCVLTFIVSVILIIGAIVTGLLLPSKITYESNVNEATDDERKS